MKNRDLFVVSLGNLPNTYDSLDKKFPALDPQGKGFIFIGESESVKQAGFWAKDRNQEWIGFDLIDGIDTALKVANSFEYKGFSPSVIYLGNLKKKSKPIKSFSVIVTKECMREAAILLYSLRVFHSEPVFIICDDESKKYLEEFNFKDINFRTEANQSDLKKADELCLDVDIRNTYHRRDCILLKMDVWKWAIEECGDSLFLDADILCVSNLNGSNTGDLTLSPHYHAGPKLDTARDFGIFNAGYLWSNKIEVPDYWREIYLEGSNFYEQECMYKLVHKFNTDFFSESHNIGFWRFPDCDINGVRSWHVHLTEDLFTNANDGLKRKYREHSELVLDWCNQHGRLDICDFVEKISYEK
jgi:hypothetical protein